MTRLCAHCENPLPANWRQLKIQKLHPECRAPYRKANCRKRALNWRNNNVERSRRTGRKWHERNPERQLKRLRRMSLLATAMEKLPVEILSASQAIIIDTGNYYPSRDGENINLKDGLTDSEWAAKVLGHPVIKAFNNILSQSLASKPTPVESLDRVALSVAGNEAEHKHIVQALINEIGFDAIDGGSLSESWRQQPGTPAYCKDLDKEALAAALQEADASKRAQYLEMADESIRPFL